MLEREIRIADLDALLVGDVEQARFVVVMLHGFAMTPRDLSPFAHSLGIPGLFVFPRAPLEAALEPGKPFGRAWWHIDPVARATALMQGPRDFGVQHPVDLPRARKDLFAFLDGLATISARLPNLPLFLAGFSQGGMLISDAFMRHPERLRVTGLALFSTSRIAVDEWPAPESCVAARGLPVLLSHGRADADLAFAAGEGLRDVFVRAGAAVTFLPFDQGHEIPLVVWRGFRRFLLKHVP